MRTFALMTFTALSIITLILSLAAVVATFVPRLPAVAASYAALVCAHLAGAVYVDTTVLVYWGVATAIVLGLRMLQPKALVEAGHGQGYVALATIVGVVLGYLCSPTAAAVILGGAIAAFLGATAYMRTPAGPGFGISSRHFIEYLCAKGLPCVVACSMSTIAVASLL